VSICGNNTITPSMAASSPIASALAGHFGDAVLGHHRRLVIVCKKDGRLRRDEVRSAEATRIAFAPRDRLFSQRPELRRRDPSLRNFARARSSYAFG
jgi:hypothetical protein